MKEPVKGPAAVPLLVFKSTQSKAVVNKAGEVETGSFGQIVEDIHRRARQKKKYYHCGGDHHVGIGDQRTSLFHPCCSGSHINHREDDDCSHHQHCGNRNTKNKVHTGVDLHNTEPQSGAHPASSRQKSQHIDTFTQAPSGTLLAYRRDKERADQGGLALPILHVSQGQGHYGIVGPWVDPPMEKCLGKGKLLCRRCSSFCPKRLHVELQRLRHTPEHQPHAHPSGKQHSKPCGIAIFRSGIIRAQAHVLIFTEKSDPNSKAGKQSHCQRIKPAKAAGDALKQNSCHRLQLLRAQKPPQRRHCNQCRRCQKYHIDLFSPHASTPFTIILKGGQTGVKALIHLS